MSKTRFAAFCGALALLAFVAVDVTAQDQGGRRGGRGGFGGGPPGGFGGGFGGRGGPGGGRGGASLGGQILNVMRVEKVQEELELMPEQQEAMGKLAGSVRDQMREKMSDIMGGGGFGSGRPDPSKMEELRAEMEKVTKKALEQAEEVLFPEQMERAKQIAIQQMGNGALQDPEIAEELGLKPSQVDEMKSIRETFSKEQQEKFAKLRESGDREAMFEAFRSMRDDQKKVEEKAFDVLTSEQKSKFEEMKGEPFEMPQQGRGGFGGGRGGFGGGFGGRGGDRGGDRGGRRQRPDSE
ncbi:MAG: hypothetical protein AAGA03_14065 [Planctomycetota bacterium]